MRDPARIERILTKVKILWKQNPDARFFQIVEYLKLLAKEKGYPDAFFFEDDEMEKALESLLNHMK